MLLYLLSGFLLTLFCSARAAAPRNKRKKFQADQPKDIESWTQSVTGTTEDPSRQIPRAPSSIVGSATTLSSIAPSESVSRRPSEQSRPLVQNLNTPARPAIAPLKKGRGGVPGTPDEAREPRTPHFTRDSPAFHEARNNSAAIVQRQSKFQPAPMNPKYKHPPESVAGGSSRTGSSTRVEILVDPPSSDGPRGSPEPVASVKRRQTSTVSNTLLESSPH